MKKLKIASLLMLAIMVISLLAGCASKPKTLEEYIEKDEDAKAELDQIAKSMSSDQSEGSIDVKENTVTITLTLKETYESDYLEAIKKSFENAVEANKSVLADQIASLEDKAEIDDASMVVLIKNGDGTEIVKKEFTSDDAGSDPDTADEEE